MSQMQLYRSRTDRMVGGVCGGLGEFFNVDPVLIRLAFAFAIVLLGTGFLLYIILWIVIPEEPIMGKEGKSIYQEIIEDKDGKEIKEEIKGAINEVRDSVKKAAKEGRMSRYEDRTDGSGVVGGILLITIGTLFLIDRYFDVDFGKLWPVILIAIGLGLLIRSGGRRRE